MSDTELGQPTILEAGVTDQTAGEPVTEPEPWDGADGLPLSGEYGVSTSTRVRHDHLESASNAGGAGRQAFRATERPVLVRHDLPDVLACYTRTGAALSTVRLLGANPRRTSVRAGCPMIDVIVQLGPSEAAAQSVTMSWALSSNTPFEEEHQGELWAHFPEEGTVTVSETLRSGLTDGQAIDHGGA